MDDLVKKYVKLDDELKQINDTAKDIKDRKKTITDLLIQTMIQSGKESIVFEGGKLSVKVKVKPGALNKETIQTGLTDYLQTANKPTKTLELAEKAAAHILENRGGDEEAKLVRTKK